jgi:hypothetical protein
VGQGVVRVLGQRLAEALDGPLCRFLGELIPVEAAAEVERIGIGIDGRPFPEAAPLRFGQAQAQPFHQGRQVVERIVLRAPELAQRQLKIGIGMRKNCSGHNFPSEVWGKQRPLPTSFFLPFTNWEFWLSCSLHWRIQSSPK